ncbi:MAG: DUF445 domain-containing protein [Saprospiraceae bacterium]
MDFQSILDSIIYFFTSRPDIWVYLVIPITAAVIGWGTNVLALKMTFYPVDFIGVEADNNEWFGIKPVGWEGVNKIGWQGIIPAKASVMASKAVDMMLGKLIDLQEQFAQIDPEIVADEMSPRLEALSRQIIEEAMTKEMPLIWNRLPQRRKEQIYEDAAKEFPNAIEVIMNDIKEHIDELFDVKAMVVHELTTNKKLLNYIFLKVGKDEFKFIEKSGFYFGFIFGVIQMILSILLPNINWLLLPVGGVVIGYLTNWLALRLIFQPVNPVKVGPITFQGLFIKRQTGVAAEYAKIVAAQILNTPNIFQAILHGVGAEQLSQIVEKHIRAAVDKTAGFSRSLIQITSGTKTYEAVKNIATARFMEVIPENVKYVFDYAEEALDIENTIKTRMAELPPEEFVDFLRPVFQEDEMKLILVGAALGGMAGLFQLLAITLQQFFG